MIRMRLLLDTCTFLWLAADDPMLTADALDSCRDPDNEVFLSALSAWEIAVKHRLGRLPLPEPPHRYVVSRRRWLGLEPLEFDETSAAHDALLPSHHRDPFDRGLVSQAILNGMMIVTPDEQIARYPAPVLW
ncbi:MAG: type II toxin-antitoxin system VapC family toxin [Pseudomonadales bacterium]|nr:type II toxin-antitoxin system VapC family toxin [Pseudomonadales bacterium]